MRPLTRADILSQDEYERRRPELRARNIARKRARRMHVGPFASFYFESRDTMWMQIQEMLRIERGGEEQIAGELEAYNPLIPRGSELVATMMIEIDDAHHRTAVLARLGGIEGTVALAVGGQAIPAVPTDPEEERTTPGGKTSSIHFLRFAFTGPQVALFRTSGTQVALGVNHPNYLHTALVPEPVREALAGDFD